MDKLFTMKKLFTLLVVMIFGNKIRYKKEPQVF